MQKCSPECPLCYANRRCRERHRGHRYHVAQSGTRVLTEQPGSGDWTTMKREAKQTEKHATEWHGIDEPLFESYPLLGRALADQWWDDGKPRTPYSLKVQLASTGCQVSVIDETERRSSYTASRTIHGALALIESLLSGGDLPWRSWGGKR